MTGATLRQSGPPLFPLCDDIHAVTAALIKDQIKNTWLFNKLTMGGNIVFAYEGRRISDKWELLNVTDTEA